MVTAMTDTEIRNEVEVQLFCVWFDMGGATQGRTCLGVYFQREEGRKADGGLSSLLQG